MTPSFSKDPYPVGLPRLDNAGWRAEYEKVYTPNYGTRRLAFVRGEGSWVWDAGGKRYLDFLTGISVCSLGHCHPRITRAIQEQAATLVHCSNLYYIPVQVELARLLVSHSFADRVFFGNSGAEANEAAIKIARRWMRENRGPGRHGIITLEESFHGRTLATLTATGQKKVQVNFDPLLEGFKYARFDDLDSVRAMADEHTGAVMVEPILGEGGIRPLSRAFVEGIRRLCDERGMLLIFDEVQTGLGRTGTLWGYEYYGVTPDIMTIAKSLGGGLAMGAMLCTDAVGQAFAPGSHGSTMGGNALTSAAAHAYVSELIEGNWPARAAETGQYLTQRLARAIEPSRLVREIRGRGLMIGVELTEGAPDVLLACEEAGLLVNVTASQTVRLLPPLNTTREEVDQAVDILSAAILKQEV
ncbi:MAG: aspartate aminotransferase family protein [bacterium]|nr:aspartate aminotransferase family protein [bacterium]